VLYFDGAFKKSTCQASGGIVVHDNNNEEVLTDSVHLPQAKTNNEAEYGALQYGLEQCLKLQIQCLSIKGDSLLIV